MSRRAAGRLAWVLYGLAAALAVSTIALALLNNTSLRDFLVYYAAVGPTVGLSSPLLGALILARYPDNRVGWVLCALGVGLAAVLFGSEYARYALLTRPDSVPGGAAVGWLYNWGWMSIFALVPLLFLLFPDGRLRNRKWRPVGWATAITLAGPAAVVAVVTWQYRGPYLMSGEELLPATAPQFSLVEAVEGGYFIAMTVLIAAGVASVLARLRHAAGVERQQIKWLLYGGGVAVAITVVTTVFPTLETGLTALLTFAALLGAIAVAIFRYRLYDVDRIINRTLVYAVLTGVLGVSYAGVVLILGQIVGQGRSSLVAGATLAVAALFQPARRRIQDQVDRRFNRRRYDAAKTIQAFSGRLRQEIDLDTLTAALPTVVHTVMEPTNVSLWLRASTERPGGQ
jgi:MFS family permease